MLFRKMVFQGHPVDASFEDSPKDASAVARDIQIQAVR